jgi:hypothetical protein
MSTWISKAVAAGLLALAAGPGLAEGLRVVPPRGYCIDKAASAAIVLMGRCAGVANRPPAILTAAVGGPGSAGALGGGGEALAAFFTSEAGKKALSRSGRARSVTVLEAVGVRDAFLIRLADTSPGGRAQPESWRAVVGLGGRMVTLTATGPAAAPLTREEGRRLIEDFLRAMRNANRNARG